MQTYNSFNELAAANGAPTFMSLFNANVENTALKPVDAATCANHGLKAAYQFVSQGTEGTSKGAITGDVVTQDGVTWKVRYKGQTFDVTSPQEALQKIDAIDGSNLGIQAVDSDVQKLLEKAYADMRHNKLPEWDYQNLMQVLMACRANGNKMNGDLRQSLITATKQAVQSQKANQVQALEAYNY